MILPGSLPLGRELLDGLGNAIRHSLIGAWLVVGALVYIGHQKQNAQWVYAICLTCLFLIYFNLRQIDRLAAGDPALHKIRRAIVFNLLTYASVACLLAATPWLIGQNLNAYGELLLTLVLVGYSVLFAFTHSALPWLVFVFALINCVSLTIFWANSAYDFKWPLAALTAIFFILMMRATFNFGLVLRRSLRLQIERDAARLRAENSARGLETALADLQRANGEKLRLFAAANHDLRQPISAISLFVGVLHRKLKRKFGDDDEVNDLLDKLDRNIQTLDVIVSSLSELTSLERGGMKVQPRVFDLRPLINDVVREFQGQAEGLNTPLRVQLPALRMFTDPAMLARIVRNVLDNALKYAPGGEIVLSMSPIAGASRFSLNERPMMLSIRDHGPGIPAPMRGHVFDEYIQVDNPARDRKKGYGLGLSIAKRLADALGTTIELRAAEGGGLEFLMDMAPMVSTRIREIGDATPESMLDGMQARLLHSSLDTNATDIEASPPQSIVLVDDDDDVRAGLQALFESWGHEVRGFDTLKATFEHLGTLTNANQPDHILIDNWLPDGRGIECVPEFQKQCPGARLVLLTGDSDAKTVARGVHLGLPVLIKPVTANKLAQVLRPPKPAAGLTAYSDSLH